MQFVQQRTLQFTSLLSCAQFRKFSVFLENIDHIQNQLFVGNKEIKLSDGNSGIWIIFEAQIHNLTEISTKNVGGILANSLKLEEKQKLVVIYDKDFPLTLILAEAYARNRKDCKLVEFSSKPPGTITILI